MCSMRMNTYFGMYALCVLITAAQDWHTSLGKTVLLLHEEEEEKKKIAVMFMLDQKIGVSVKT